MTQINAFPTHTEQASSISDLLSWPLTNLPTAKHVSFAKRERFKK